MSVFSQDIWNVSPSGENSNLWTGIWVFTSAVLVALVAPMIAHESKISEFRQNWINELRKDIAEYSGICRKWYHLRQNETHPGDELFTQTNTIATDATTVLWRIKMRINPLDNEYKYEDQRFLRSLDALLLPNPPGKARQDVVEEALQQSRLLLKREWQVTKGVMPHWARSVLSQLRSVYRRWRT